jgi:EF-P beta-lysylation protein EpmB
MLLPCWKKIRSKNFTTIDALATYLNLSSCDRSLLLDSPSFPLNVPLRLAAKMPKGTIHDPLTLQFLPLREELITSPSFTEDPLHEHQLRHGTRLIHKYHGRAVLICSQSCSQHCRYCFRKHFYSKECNPPPSFDTEIDMIHSTPSLSEIILSGGDPLSLDNNAFSHLLSRLEKVEHLSRLRIHSRFPIGIPERIDDVFCSMMESSKLKIWFVIQCNHPRELDADVIASLHKLSSLGIPLLCQTVLLKNINDDEETLFNLFTKLIDNGITPYYLHQLDRVQGVEHFEVEKSIGKRLLTALSSRLPGYGCPSYVEDLPSSPSKLHINP